MFRPILVRGPKLLWVVLFIVGLLVACCAIGAVTGGPVVKVEKVPTATATPRLARNTATPEAEPTAASSTPTVAARATDAPVAAPPSKPGDESYPCAPGQIKGNRDSKIYHSPGGASYAQTQENVRCFDSAADAEAQGYRAAKN